MDENLNQRVCLKFCVANQISCAELLKMLRKAYGESALSKTLAYEWYEAFKEGREVVVDLSHSGRPSTSLTDENTKKVKEMVMKNHHSSLRKMSQDLATTHESVLIIF